MSGASEQAVLNNQWNAAQEANITEQARRAPHVLMRPTLSADGTMWCALYGNNIQEGIAGFGETPEKAMEAFDNAWFTERTPAANRVIELEKNRLAIEENRKVHALLTSHNRQDEP